MSRVRRANVAPRNQEAQPSTAASPSLARRAAMSWRCWEETCRRVLVAEHTFFTVSGHRSLFCLTQPVRLLPPHLSAPEPRAKLPNPDRRSRRTEIPHVGMGFKMPPPKAREAETQTQPCVTAFHTRLLLRQCVWSITITPTRAHPMRFPRGKQMRCGPLKACRLGRPPPAARSLGGRSRSQF